ncbi:hypothetical protein HK405_003715 [Cladochytrium tenue]|nr:hypothetical protein HK405_003715 [Cladochytrium tenue]
MLTTIISPPGQAVTRFTPADILTHTDVAAAYDLAPPFRNRLEGRGVASITATVRRRSDGRTLVIKRVEKAVLRSDLWFTAPCCCGRPLCRGGNACPKNPPDCSLPLELVLMKARGTNDNLPELVAVYEDKEFLYYITETHGLKRRK